MGQDKIMAGWQLGVLQQSVRLSDQDIERRKRVVELTAADLPRIATVKSIVSMRADALADGFFEFMKGLDEAAALFRRSDLLAETKRLQHENLIAMVSGVYGRDYVEQRLQLGFLYSKVGLNTRVLLGAFHHLMRTVGVAIMANATKDPQGAFECFMSLKKIGFLDMSLIIDVMMAERDNTINAQQEAIRELSTPVLQIRDRLLILPIIGVLDTFRARQLTDSLLHAIRANRAKVVVMDITGVAAVDSKVANHLIQTVAASRLMGATVIVTGLSADVAQALVGLGVDLSSLNTVGDLQGGLELAERNLGYRIVAQHDSYDEQSAYAT
ncbi:MAG: protoglobin domain-containing protein [Aliidongia sp.]